MLRQTRPNRLILALSLSWLFAMIATAHSEQAAPTVATLDLADFLKAEELATKHASDVVEHALTVFTWIVGVVGGLLVAGAALLGWAIQRWSRANRTDIQNEVEKQLQSEAVKAIESEIAATKQRIEKLDREANEFSRQLEEARNRVGSTLDLQQERINQLIILTMGQFPHAYLKSIHDRKEGFDPKQEFLWHQQPGFKREMGFLIDHGYLENIGLEGFTDRQNIFDKLTLTEAGKLYVKLRERVPSQAI